MDGSQNHLNPEIGSYLDQYLIEFHEELTADSTIELAINSDCSLWILSRGDVYMRKLDKRVSPNTVKNLIAQIAGQNRIAQSKTNIIISASVHYKGRAIRAQCVSAPATSGVGVISMRLFSPMPLDQIRINYLFGEAISLTEKREERNRKLLKMVTEDKAPIEEVLDYCVQEKLNIVVSGGTDTGKSFLLRYIISKIPASERIITIEDAAELFPEQPNHVGLLADKENPARNTEKLLESCLRMRPDRIIVGEVRGAEAMTFLEAINTGHGGSMTTLHAETPELAIERLAIAAGRSTVPMNYAEIKTYIERSIDVIIQAGRNGTSRGVAEVYLPSITGDSK